MPLKLKERQEWCNKINAKTSSELGKDISGAMRFCPYCEFSTSKATCQIKQDRRNREKACAMAYKKMYYIIKKTNNKENIYD